MNRTEIEKILIKQNDSVHKGLIISSLSFQLVIMIGYIRSIILKDKELTFFIVPLLFISLLMNSISFGTRDDDKKKSKEEFIFYLIITILLSIIFIMHFFKRKLIKYKKKIHQCSIIFLLISIVMSFLLLI